MSNLDDITVHLPAALRTHIEMVADERDVSFDDAVIMIMAMGLACRASHDFGIDEDIAVGDLLVSLRGFGDDGRLKKRGLPE